MAADQLRSAVNMEHAMAGEVVVMKDILNVGPLQKGEGQKFSELRGAFWQSVTGNDKQPAEVDDIERLILTGNELAKSDAPVIWLWVAPWPADLCMYHWAVKFLGKYSGRLYVVNIAGLPFLDENGKLFFPKNVSEIAPRELVKARKLARVVTPAEIEVDGFEWGKLVDENGGIRTHEGGKRLVSRTEEHYDHQLSSFCSHQFQKASRVVGQALTKFNLPTGDVYLGWRLKKMAESGKLELQGDASKTLRDFEVRLPVEDTLGIP